MKTERTMPTARRVRPFTAVLCMCALAATLLLWTKLRLVNGLPRTAVAEPMHERPAPKVPKADAPPSPNDDWTQRDRIPPFE